MTRDEKIEALAMSRWSANCEMDMSLCLALATAAVEELNRWRAARQPAPETPTPRIEVLKRWLECCVELDCEAIAFLYGQGDRQIHRGKWSGVCVNADELDALRQHAATLKERKEKADAR